MPFSNYSSAATPTESNQTLGTVYVVDDDEAVRDSIRWLLEASDYKVELYDSGESFIAKYDPFADTLRLEFTVTTADSCEEGEYVPTVAESQLIKEMIAEKLREEFGQTPKEFCEDVDGIEIGGMMQ